MATTDPHLEMAALHLDAARTALIEAGDGDASDSATLALATLAAAHSEVGKLELMLADLEAALAVRIAELDDRVFFHVALCVVPGRFLVPLFGATTTRFLAGTQPEPVGSWCAPANWLRNIVQRATPPELLEIADRLGCAFWRVEGIDLLALPADWRAVVGRLRDLHRSLHALDTDHAPVLSSEGDGESETEDPDDA